MVVNSDPDRSQVIPFLKKWFVLIIVSGLIYVLTIAIAFQCSYLISYHRHYDLFLNEKPLFNLFLGTLPFWLFLLFLIKSAEIPTKHFKILFFVYLNSAMVILILIIMLYYVFRLSTVSWLFLIFLPFSGFFLLFIVRLLKYKFGIKSGMKGYNHINSIIVAEDSSLPIIKNLISDKGLGYKVVVIFTESALVRDNYEKTSIILPEKYLGILNDLIEVDLIDEVLYLKDNLVTTEIREIVKTCEELGVTLRLRHDNPVMSLSSGMRTDIANGKFLSFINIRNNSFSFAVKKTVPVNLAMMMIFFLLPVFVIIGMIIKLTSPGPVISKELTPGHRGRQFYLYKFRTNVIKAHQPDTDTENKTETREQEPVEYARITKIGEALRISGLDKLPQLFNVLKGNIPMSMIFGKGLSSR